MDILSSTEGNQGGEKKHISRVWRILAKIEILTIPSPTLLEDPFTS